MGKYISKQQLMNMLKDIPDSGMLAITDDAGRDGGFPVVGVRESTLSGFHEIIIDTKEKW